MPIIPRQGTLLLAAALALTGCSGPTEHRSLHDLNAESGVHVDYEPVDTGPAVVTHATDAAVVRLTDVHPGHQRQIRGENRYEFASLTAEVVEPLHGSSKAGEVLHLEMIRPEGSEIEDLRAALPAGEVVAVWSPWTGDSAKDASLTTPEDAVVDAPPRMLFADGLWYEDSGELENPMVPGEDPGSPWAGAEGVEDVAQSIKESS